MEIPALTKTEQVFKESYFNYPKRHLDMPCQPEEAIDIIHKAYFWVEGEQVTENLNHVGEQLFITSNMDTAFVMHSRYTPAFWHKHDFFEIIYVLNGSCTNYIMDKTECLKIGDICIMAPGVTHALGVFDDETVVLNILIRNSTFEKSFMGLFEENSILSDFFEKAFYHTSELPYILVHTGDDQVLQELIERVYKESQVKKRYQKQMANTMVSLFFITLFRRHEQHFEVPDLHLHTSDVNLMYILRYMQTNYKTVSLKELSSIFNYSERQLQRIILKATGHTFVENIQNQKMKKAAKLLSETTMPVSEIGESVGFQSLNNFRKIFVKFYGMTPSEYRNQSLPNLADFRK